MKPEFEPWLRPRVAHLPPPRQLSRAVLDSASRIKDEIAARGKTITSVAEELGCRRNSLSSCVNRTSRRPYGAVRRKLARYLGYSVAELFGADANDCTALRRAEQSRRASVGLSPVDIKRLIAERGQSVRGLARILDVDAKHLSYCINRTYKHSFARIRRMLAEWLGVSVKELFGDDRAANSRAA